MRPRVVAPMLALAAALACGGCSFGPGSGSSAATLRVTEDFGAHTVTSVAAIAVGHGETDLGMLRRHARIQLGADGRVSSIAGHAQRTGDDRWSYYVNGEQPKKSAATTPLYPGDHVWWDLHARASTHPIPAVVGAFPEPFRHGLNGKRYPSTIECGAGLTSSCALISHQFAHFHIPLSPAGVGYGSGTDSLSVNVGTWAQLRGEVVGGLIAKGPGASGVYAHFVGDGRRLALQDAAGRVVRVLGGAAGLIAATAGPSNVPTWLVTGTDLAGVRAAARALTPAALAGHFALAVDGARHLPVPVGGG
jgi:hypothetical protein